LTTSSPSVESSDHSGDNWATGPIGVATSSDERSHVKFEKVEDEEEFPAEVDDDDDDEEGEAGDAEADEEAGDASLEEILTKKPEERPAPEEEEDEDSILSLGREERIETLSVKVVPQDPNKEFTCRNCYLVKHRSQLADKKRMFCRDCV
jgi:Domain of unknown function (DUF4193)